MSKYIVYYRADSWRQQDGYSIQQVRQGIPDGRILIVDLWNGLDAVRPIILSIALEGQSNQPSAVSSDTATRLFSQDITLVPAQEEPHTKEN